MITYVTCDDVDNAFGSAWTSENAKNKAVLMANAWLNGFNLKINPSRIPEEVKLAGAYAARIASCGKLFQQKNDSGVVISKAVSADGVSVSKSFAELPANSTVLLEPDLQLAIALLKPYGLSRSQVRVVRGG
ncbi:TPA: protein singed [Escherichia coli]|nr:protein singed [Escherichia coli]HAU7934754.1 protein singed [Escherichia coli]HBM9680698.1 protein singed [Escherichia coli]